MTFLLQLGIKGLKYINDGNWDNSHAIIKWKSFHYFPGGLKIPLNILERTVTGMYKNHGNDDTRTQTPLIPSVKNNRFGHTNLTG